MDLHQALAAQQLLVPLEVDLHQIPYLVVPQQAILHLIVVLLLLVAILLDLMVLQHPTLHLALPPLVLGLLLVVHLPVVLLLNLVILPHLTLQLTLPLLLLDLRLVALHLPMIQQVALHQLEIRGHLILPLKYALPS
uniref:Uncharacterized protein n=1 Tax=Cacopsylla melanoneura TaxID=428564 RepID=A0A8D8VUW2_9HEMI